MPTTFTPPDHEFAASSGSNVNYDSDWSYFDHPPNSTSNLTITSNAGDLDPNKFDVGEAYDITWTGHDGGNMEDAVIIRSDYLGPGEGAIVFEGTNSVTGELFQMVWSPGFDLESWYWDSGGGPSSPNSFWTSDQSEEDFQYVCYAQGTLIRTPKGEVAVEDLAIGDLVETLDHGPQPIRWMRQDEQPLLASEMDEKPVLISAMSLGGGFPSADLIVSPQHRVFVGGQGQLQHLFKFEAFVPAKSLTPLRGVRHMKGKTRVVWCHFAFDQHEVVFANGCLAESLLLGPVVIKGLSESDRKALIAVFGAATRPDGSLNGPTARPCLKAGKVRRRLETLKTIQGRRLAFEVEKWNLDVKADQRQAVVNAQQDQPRLLARF